MLLLAQTALFNHSCRPNAAVYAHESEDELVQVRLLRDVQQGQEIAICYDSSLHKMPKQRRQALLHSRWGFECGCPRCTTQSDQVDALLTATRADLASAQLAVLELEFERCATVAETATRAATDVLQTGATSDVSSAEVASATAGLTNSIKSLRALLVQAEGLMDVTHWRMQHILKLTCVCLWLQHMMLPHAPRTDDFDPDLGFSEAPDIAQLRRLLHVALAAEAATSPALHPMRLELYGMWQGLPQTGDEWKTGGVFDDLDRLSALWHHADAPLSSPDVWNAPLGS